MKIVITGASGFIGSSLCSSLLENGSEDLTLISRTTLQTAAGERFIVPEINGDTDWANVLYGRHAVIHTAALAHVMNDSLSDPMLEYRQTNVHGTLNLASQAAAAGVKRFVFISSIGVNGNTNFKPFTEADTPNPAELYAQSKFEAEEGLWEIQRETGMEVVIIRPPLVYGRNAPGNFGKLVRWVNKELPLPLGSIHNQRSLVALDNLVDLIITCIDHPAAANQVFLAGDGQDLSTTELLRGVAIAAGKPSRLIPIPSSLLMFGATLLGKKAVAQRLLGSLQVDISKARDLLGWEPPISVEEGLRRCFSKD